MYQTTDQESKKQIGLKSSPDPIPTNSATRINVLYIYILTQCIFYLNWTLFLN